MTMLHYSIDPGKADRTARWMYRGIWSLLVRLFRVPKEPPLLPAHESDDVLTFRPSPAFLSYLKVQFWIGWTCIGLVTLIPLIALAVAEPIAGAIATLLVLPFCALLMVVTYVSIHLHFDTVWYVISDRAMRLRQGVWSVHEVTITFENVQNIRVRQGPVQRFFGIADVVVDTAGGGGAVQSQGKPGAANLSHHGVIRGIANAADLRDRISKRLKQSRSAGIGDEHPIHEASPAPHSAWSPSHLQLLREISDSLQH